MSFNDVMYGPLGQVNNQFQNNLAQNAAGMANSNALVNSWQNMPQVSQQELYGSGGFGAMTDYYSALGAAYGRGTGGFNASPGAVGTIDNPGTSNPGYLTYGGGADQAWAQGGSQGSRPSSGSQGQAADEEWYQGGSQGARPSSIWEGGAAPFNDYGGGANPGGFSPSPNYPGGFGGAEDQAWYQGGSVGQRPSESPSFKDMWKNRIAPQVPNIPSSVTVPQQQSFGGPADVQWMQAGSQGPRPSQAGAWGGAEDVAWMQGGSQGQRPSISTDLSAKSRNAPSFAGMYDWGTSFGNRDPGTTTALRNYGQTVAPQANPFEYNPHGAYFGSRDALAQALMRQGAGLNMPSGQFGGASPNTFGAPSSGYLGAQGSLVQDPFGAYVNPQSLDAGGSFPANYQPGYNALPLVPNVSS